MALDLKKVLSAINGKTDLDISSNLKKQAKEKLEKMNRPKSVISKYTPKPGEAERLDKEKLQRIIEDNAPLNRFASSKAAKNIQDAIEFAAIIDGGVAASKLIGKGAKAAGKYLTEETALRNAYKYNPFAFKANPEAYYRMIGKAGYADALESGVIRPPVGSGHMEAYYNKGYPLDIKFRNTTGRAGYEGPYMAEVKGSPELFINENTQGFTGPMFEDPIHYSTQNIPINKKNIDFYKEHWLKGYKKVKKNK